MLCEVSLVFRDLRSDLTPFNCRSEWWEMFVGHQCCVFLYLKLMGRMRDVCLAYMCSHEYSVCWVATECCNPFLPILILDISGPRSFWLWYLNCHVCCSVRGNQAHPSPCFGMFFFLSTCISYPGQVWLLSVLNFMLDVSRTYFLYLCGIDLTRHWLTLAYEKLDQCDRNGYMAYLERKPPFRPLLGIHNWESHACQAHL